MKLFIKILITILLFVSVAYFTDRMYLIYKGINWVTESIQDLRIHIMAFFSK